MAQQGVDMRPWWSTAVKMRLSEGRVVGVDGSMWAVRAVPMVPIVDARNDDQVQSSAMPVYNALERLSQLATASMGRRSLSKSSYREVQQLTVNIPDRYRAPSNLPNAASLNADFGHMNVTRRITVFGVRLLPRMKRKGQGPFAAAVESVAESWVTGSVPLEDYSDDFEQVNDLLNECGLEPCTPAQLALVDAWWNFGMNPDVPVLVHPDHCHVFGSAQAAAVAARAMETQGPDECLNWHMQGEYKVTFASVSSVESTWLPIVNKRAMWGAELLAAGALAVSVRGLVEPAKVTAGEMRRHIREYESDINERLSQGKTTKAEQDHDLSVLREIEGAYSVSGGMATLHAARITVALDGALPNPAAALPDSILTLGSLAFRQQAAMSEMMLGSAVRANPTLHDLPVSSIAGAALSSLSTVGDANGALLGLSELDRQPAYISPSAVSDTDSFPLMVVAGATGSGKTMALLHLARQWASVLNRQGERTPVIFIDPKEDSDFSDAVVRLGGQVFSLDSLVQADGVFDPLRVVADAESGVDLAAAMLGDINPWPDGRQAHEVPLLKALRFGVTNGAKCIGQALTMAMQAGQVSEATVRPIFDLLDASPLFRSIFGLNPEGQALRTAEGISLIKVGAQALPLPQPGDASPPLVPRIGQWVLRMMVYGSASAVRGRDGVVILDEAWQFVQGQAGSAELQRLGRLARSMRVLPVLASQRIQDFLRAELAGYVSRGLLLGLDRGRGPLDDGSVDNGEAGAALAMFGITPTEERLSRMAAKQFIEGTNRPNPFSLKAMRDPVTREVLRGSIAYAVDLSGRVVPVEITIPPSFLREISTNSEDMAERSRQSPPPTS